MVSREWGIGLGRALRTRSGLSAVLRLCPVRVVFLVKLTQFSGWLHGYADGASQKGVEGFGPKDLTLEHDSEVTRDGFGNKVQVQWLAELLLHRSHGLGGDAAGNDQVEEGEVGVHVECKTVRGDEAGDVDADGGEFSFKCVLGRPRFAWPDSRGGCRHKSIRGFGVGPDSGQTNDSLGGDREVGAGADQDFFQAAHKFDYA